MGKSIISQGNTTNEAIKEGLKKLNLTKDDVEIKVIEDDDKKVFFNILEPRVVKVKITEKDHEEHSNEEKKQRKLPSMEDYDSAEKNARLFLDDFVKAFKNISYEITGGERLDIVIKGEDASKLIGYRGETINSLQTLLSSIANKNTSAKVGISVDILNYKEKREDELKALAHKIEKTVNRTKKKVTLEPMPAYERKIIHTELQNSNVVTTYSIGEEPHRRIVVDLKK